MTIVDVLNGRVRYTYASKEQADVKAQTHPPKKWVRADECSYVKCKHGERSDEIILSEGSARIG